MSESCIVTCPNCGAHLLDSSDDKAGTLELPYLPSKKETDRLRDEFAMAALTGLISDNLFREACRKAAEKRDLSITEPLANLSYEMADAMLKAREVKHES